MLVGRMDRQSDRAHDAWLMPVERIHGRRLGSKLWPLAGMDPGRKDLDDEPRLEDDQNPRQPRHAYGRRLAGFEARNGRLTESTSPRQRMLTPWDPQPRRTDCRADLLQGCDLRCAVALHPIGHAASKQEPLIRDSIRGCPALHAQLSLGCLTSSYAAEGHHPGNPSSSGDRDADAAEGHHPGNPSSSGDRDADARPLPSRPRLEFAAPDACQIARTATSYRSWDDGLGHPHSHSDHQPHEVTRART
jgi:hypothetical protein